MRRQRLSAKFHEPSLVPLADMLTNTVGIVVFILIFTVLTAGGVVIIKRLPMERSTNAVPLHFVCAGGRLLPMNPDALIGELMKPIGWTISYDTASEWIERFNARQVDDEYFVVQGEAERTVSSVRAVAKFTPREGEGETITELEADRSRFREILRTYQPRERFVYFFVRTDSLDTFFAARSIAMGQMGFGSGWGPLEPREPIRFLLTRGGGVSPTEQ